MKKCIICLLLLYLLSPIVSAQNEVDVFWGKENPLSRKENIELLGKRGNNLIGYIWSKGTLSLVKFGYSDLQRKNHYPLLGGKSDLTKVIDASEYTFEQFILLKEKTYIVVSHYDRKADLYSLHAQEIGEDGRLTGQLKMISKISASKRRNTGSFDIILSNDSTQILLVNNPPYEKYSGEKFAFKVLEDNLNEKNHVEVSLPYQDKNFAVHEFRLARDGNIYMMAQIYVDTKNMSKAEAKKRAKQEASYYYEILSVNPNGAGQVLEYQINLDKKYITDVSYSIDHETNQIICSGFYDKIDDKRERHEINGIFFCRINKENRTIEAVGTKPLDKAFIEDLTSKKNADKGRGITNAFTLKHFVRKTDGSAILVSESSYNYVTRSCSTDSKGNTRCTNVYHYVRNNIIVININPDGSIKWYANVPKYQHTINDNGVFSSFIFGTKRDKMYFIYNENPVNFDPEKVKEEKDMKTLTNPRKSAVVALATLDEAGNYDKKILINEEDQKLTVAPSLSARTDEHEYIVQAVNLGSYCCIIPLKAGKSKLVRFTFK